jgi:hypothetical protein
VEPFVFFASGEASAIALASTIDDHGPTQTNFRPKQEGRDSLARMRARAENVKRLSRSAVVSDQEDDGGMSDDRLLEAVR